MGGATAWVPEALRELGGDASDVAIKAYVRENEPTIPESHIGLALRKLRGNVVRDGGHSRPPRPLEEHS